MLTLLDRSLIWHLIPGYLENSYPCFALLHPVLRNNRSWVPFALMFCVGSKIPSVSWAVPFPGPCFRGHFAGFSLISTTGEVGDRFEATASTTTHHGRLTKLRLHKRPPSFWHLERRRDTGRRLWADRRVFRAASPLGLRSHRRPSWWATGDRFELRSSSLGGEVCTRSAPMSLSRPDGTWNRSSSHGRCTFTSSIVSCCPASER
jgi:hypothetical protein